MERRANPRKRKTVAVLATVATAFTLGACGTGDGGEEGPSAGLTGAPIRVMTMSAIETTGVAYPNVAETAKLYAELINDNGGIGGRPLEVEICDQKVDPNAAVACARKADSDGVVAMVGGYTTYATNVLPVLEESRLAWFGPAAGTSPIEATSPVSFVLAPQTLTLSAHAYKAYKDGCRKIGFFVTSAAVQPYLIAAAENGLKKAGGTGFAVTVKAPVSTGDLTLEANRLTDDTDCIVGTVGEQTWSALIPALAQTGKTPRLYASAGQITTEVATQFPEVTQAAVLPSTTEDLASDSFKDLRDAITSYDAPDDINYNGTNLATWASFHAFTQVVENTKGDVTAASFLQAAGRTKLTMGGMTADVDLSTPFGDPAAPRVFNRSLTFAAIKDGQPVPGDGTFTDFGDFYR